MDGSTLLGFLIAALAIGFGQWIEGGSLSSLFNISALIIVLGGTFGAVLLQTPSSTLRRAFAIFPWVIFPPAQSHVRIVDMVVHWCKRTRKHGLLSIEDEISVIKDPILRKGAEYLVSGVPIDALREAMDVEIDSHEIHELEAAQVFESMGGYCPTIGILGAVIGLIQVMQNLSDPSEIGLGIAVAFVATIYGVGFANLIFLPISNKLKSCIYYRSRMYEMYLVGLLAMAAGENPRMIEMKLSGFISKHEHR